MGNLFETAMSYLRPPGRVPKVAVDERAQTLRTAAPRQEVQGTAEISYTLTAKEMRQLHKISIEQAAQLVPSTEMRRLAADAWQKALPAPDHYCLGHVRQRLEALGLGYRDPADWAIRQAPKLQQDPNFVEITGVTMANVNSLPPGCVVIYESPGRAFSTWGHATISCGNGRYASDFRSDKNVFAGTPRGQYVYAFMPVHKGTFVFDPAQARAFTIDLSDGSGTYGPDGTYTPGEGSLYSKMKEMFGWDIVAAEYLKQQAEKKRREDEKNRKDIQEEKVSPLKPKAA